MTTPLLCNLIVPGAAKSGTSSLHDILARHPNIEMSSQKEPHYFSIDAKYAQGPSSHNKLFSRTVASLYYGESSTGYLMSEKALERIASNTKNPKIIFLLRHPIERSFSHYRWRYQLGLEKRSFLDALHQSGFGYDPEKLTRFGYEAYIQFSQYSKYCPLWLDAFGSDNCLFVRSEALRTNPFQTEARIYDFLGLPCPEPQSEIRSNETKSLSRLPSKLETSLLTMFPGTLRRSYLLKTLWNKYKRSSTPVPPSSMTYEEITFLERELSESIAYYESMTV